jgi:WD40 repeat protein
MNTRRGVALAIVAGTVVSAAVCLAGAAEQRDEVPAPAAMKPIATLDETGGRSVSFSQDGKRILTTDKTAAQVWDAKTWQPVGARMEHGPGLHIAAKRIVLDRDLDPDAACFSPDGKTLAIGTYHGSTAILRVGDLGAR